MTIRNTANMDAADKLGFLVGGMGGDSSAPILSQEAQGQREVVNSTAITAAGPPPHSEPCGTDAWLTAEHFDPWDSDHTSLVHVLWAASGEGHSLEKADELAEFIAQSKWMRAVIHHAHAQAVEDDRGGD